MSEIADLVGEVIRALIRSEIAGMTQELDEKRMREIAVEETSAFASAEKIRAIALEGHEDHQRLRERINKGVFEHRNTVSHINGEYIDSRIRELIHEAWRERTGFPGPGLVRQVVAEEIQKRLERVALELRTVSL